MSVARVYIGGLSRTALAIAAVVASLVLVGVLVAIKVPGIGLFGGGGGALGPTTMIEPVADVESSSTRRDAKPATEPAPSSPTSSSAPVRRSRPVPARPRSEAPGARPAPRSPAPASVQNRTGAGKHLGNGLADVVDGAGTTLGGEADRLVPGLSRPVEDVTGLLSNTVRQAAGPDSTLGQVITGLGMGGSPPVG